MHDVLVVGSGPAGAQAVARLVAEGLSVGLVDPGKTDSKYAELIPDQTFAAIRRTCAHQRRFFLGDDLEGLPHGEMGVAAHLTPPRQFAVEDSDSVLPFRSRTFSHLQSLAHGGLGAAWGAGACTFSATELRLAGLDFRQMQQAYEEVGARVGVSLDPEDETSRFVCSLENAQPALSIDDNAARLLESFRRRREIFSRRGFDLGKAPLAVLTHKHQEGDFPRRACPYHNMDYYSDASASVYRPAYTLAGLPAGSFDHLRGYVAREFGEEKDCISLNCRNLSGGDPVTFRARRLVLAAGALNSARIVLASCRLFGEKLPLLSNELRFVPSLNLRMFGRPAREEKYSLAQLVGVMRRANGDNLISYFFSYDSLLFFKLVREMPLPVSLGHLLTRAIVTALTIVTLHFPDRPTRLKWIRVPEPAPPGEVPLLEAEYHLTYREEERMALDLKRLKSNLIRLGCFPLSVLNQGSGSSVHYAGTLPFSKNGAPFRSCRPNGLLSGSGRVYVADSAPWTFLPARGPTLTIMANSWRVAGQVAEDLRRSRA